MVWKIQRSLKVKPIEIEFIAAQIDISVLADKDDFGELTIKDYEQTYFFATKDRQWEKDAKSILNFLNETETKHRTNRST